MHKEIKKLFQGMLAIRSTATSIQNLINELEKTINVFIYICTCV